MASSAISESAIGNRNYALEIASITSDRTGAAWSDAAAAAAALIAKFHNMVHSHQLPHSFRAPADRDFRGIQNAGSTKAAEPLFLNVREPTASNENRD